MDRERAHRLLADVINLTGRRAHAEAALGHATECVGRVREEADRRIADAEESVAKMAAKVDDVDERLVAAKAAAAAVPPELAQELLAILARQRASKSAVLDALRSTCTTDDDVAALAESAGISVAAARPATAVGEGGDLGGL